MNKVEQADGTWHDFDGRGRRIHSWGWMPAEYEILGKDGQVVEGNLCSNCGKWDGPPLKRGEKARLMRGENR